MDKNNYIMGKNMGAKNKHKIWCNSERIMLQVVYSYMPTKILAERFGTTYNSIESTALRLGLKKAKEVRGQTISKALIEYHKTTKKDPIYWGEIKKIYSYNHPMANKKNHYRISEHVLIMEKHLGRFLKEGERVRHKDGNPQNNEIDNLYIVNWVTRNSLNIDEIVEKRKSGMPIDKILKEYNLTKRTLYKILNQNDCIRKKIKRVKKEKPIITQLEFLEKWEGK
jgi:hypothetical protein